MSRAAFREAFPFLHCDQCSAHFLCHLSYLTIPSLKPFLSFPYLTQENLYFSWSCMRLGSCSTGRERWIIAGLSHDEVLSQGLFLRCSVSWESICLTRYWRIEEVCQGVVGSRAQALPVTLSRSWHHGIWVLESALLMMKILCNLGCFTSGQETITWKWFSLSLWLIYWLYNCLLKFYCILGSMIMRLLQRAR